MRLHSAPAEAVNWHRLPPAGERVRLAEGDADADFARTCFAPYAPRFFASGTAALAAAVTAALARTGRRDPEVLLPAYACPAVISAVQYAGAHPRLVDLMPDRPWMDTADLEQRIRPSTAGIIGVDLFGLQERYATLARITQRSGLVLIQDGAQAFPRRHERLWHGDLVVVSFGRGKPVSLLGGGAVLHRDAKFATLVPDIRQRATAARAGFGFRVQARLYNALRNPSLYWLPAALPMLHLGETRFVPLMRLDGCRPDRLRHLQANIEAYQCRDDRPQRAIARLVAALTPELVVDLPRACAGDAPPRLLRYPLLIKDPTLRDVVHRALHQAGLGASTLYNATLPNIRGLEGLADRSYPRAEAFARQLLTLPVHSGVTSVHIERMHAILSRFGLLR